MLTRTHWHSYVRAKSICRWRWSKQIAYVCSMLRLRECERNVCGILYIWKSVCATAVEYMETTRAIHRHGWTVISTERMNDDNSLSATVSALRKAKQPNQLHDSVQAMSRLAACGAASANWGIELNGYPVIRTFWFGWKASAGADNRADLAWRPIKQHPNRAIVCARARDGEA